jgi:hypothetical protein
MEDEGPGEDGQGGVPFMQFDDENEKDAEEEIEADMLEPLTELPIAPVVDQLKRLITAAHTVPQRVASLPVTVEQLREAVHSRATQVRTDEEDVAKAAAVEAKL